MKHAKTVQCVPLLLLLFYISFIECYSSAIRTEHESTLSQSSPANVINVSLPSNVETSFRNRRSVTGCIEQNGESYTGEVNVTRSGLTCLPWDTPNLPIFVNHETFNRTLRGHNFCRNPDADDAPWCYYSINKYDFCDIPSCNSDEQDEGLVANPSNFSTGIRAFSYACPKEQYRCTSGMCIQQYWVCDGENDCIHADDESDCPDHLPEFELFSNQTIVETNMRDVRIASLLMCAKHCIEKNNSFCKSFTYNSKLTRCLINDRNRNTGVILKFNKNYQYYERKLADEICNNGFNCTNGKCIPETGRCNTTDDCGDGSDEFNCNNFAIRLVSGSTPHEGTVEVRVNDEWGIVCDDGWDFLDAEVVCHQLNYNRGAKKYHKFSYFGDGNGNYLMSNVSCRGNEPSLNTCEFPGWGRHNCFRGEAAGVTCMTTEKCDMLREFTCQSGQCIQLANACDGEIHCSDGSDENAENCTGSLNVRLIGGPNSTSGRVEIQHNGVWGTICDDTWDDADAEVLCKSLGYFGGAEAVSGSKFGSGSGPIWLDDVHCFGLEHSLDECDKGPWLKHDCSHSEDAGVVCSSGDDVTTVPASVAAILPRNCGTRAFNQSVRRHSYAKIAGGSVATKGAYPWHATLRIKRTSDSRHWCGASIITEFFLVTAAHCVEENSNASSYIVRVGDSSNFTREEEEYDFEVLNVNIHEHFQRGQRLNNDIALLQIKPKQDGRGIQFGDYVRPICLPSPTTSYTPGKSCYITGWGDTGAGAAVIRMMRTAIVPILPRSTCARSAVYGPVRLTAGMFCAGYLEGGIDTCPGDSGGPMACKMDDDRFGLFGVTSWGHGCAKPNKPGVYATVGHFLRWIYKHLNQSSLEIENIRNSV